MSIHLDPGTDRAAITERAGAAVAGRRQGPKRVALTFEDGESAAIR